jgi:hypothetical protein
MRSRILVFGLGGMAALALLAIPASAHHGWSGNDEELVLTGTVVSSVSLAGPHGSMQVRDDAGQVWDVTLAPAPRSHAAGLRDGLIPVGAEVRLEGQRNDDPESFEIKTRRVTWNGQNYDVYPSPGR